MSERLSLSESLRCLSEMCHHEAAHAVFAHHNGVAIEEVWVKQTDYGFTGRCDTRGFIPLRAMSYAAGGLAGYYAGWRGRHDGEEDMPKMSFEEFMDDSSRYSVEDRQETLEDLEWMLRLLGSSYSTLEECYEAALREAMRLLDEYWPEIQRVASALMDDGDNMNDEMDGWYLSGDEVVEIIEWTRADPPVFLQFSPFDGQGEES